ncbi:AAA family ATPase [Paenibacillus crassostreae]|uniref:YhaN AAA domain-containing protein n=1 Tax=Paenibacillus crassostreae TaxID=1763538 RepID=A0A167FWB6_9BACL|nr:AAA family ATPase [Paenibacillus crassostreae]AOZ93998.1 hypothetical protein LPB68_18615 [Paenibacillus crassostreae]OAB76967.1 hypothetical protein PNBC_06120 [Paenibacillus crassostreae]
MRIERLQIHGFGHLRELDITLNSGTTIFMGPNEAGKSTIQQFVRSMFFGIPSRTYPTERYEPLTGGVHGGVLTVIDAEGMKWSISRFAASGEGGSGSGNRTEKLSIVRSDASGQVQKVTQQEMERELLGGLSREMFNQLFAISLSELQEIRSLQSDEMNSYLFHAGIGGGTEIIQAERKLNQEMEKLYKPKGRVQEISKLLQSMEQLGKEITESKSFLRRYNDNVSSCAETLENLSSQEQTRRVSTDRLLLLRKAQDIRPTWLNWKEAKQEECSLDVVTSFPEGGIRRWESLQVEADAISLRRSQCLRNQADLQAVLDDLITDTRLGEQGSLIERLYTRRDSYEGKKSDLLEVSAEATALDLRVIRIVRQIDSRWTKKELQNFSTSVGERDIVRRYVVGFANYDRRIESLALETQQIRQHMDAAEDDCRRAQIGYKDELDNGRQRFGMMVSHNPEEVMMLWNDLQSALERWRENRFSRYSVIGQVEMDRATKKKKKRITRGLLWGSVALTLVLPYLLWRMGFVIPAIVTGSTLLIIDVILYWNGVIKYSPQRSKAADSSKREDESQDLEVITKLMVSLISDPFSTTKSDGSISSIDAGELESSVRELRKLMDQWQLWQQKLDKLRTELHMFTSQVDGLARDLTRVRENMTKEEGIFEELELKWENWLQQRELDPHLSPEAVLDMFLLAEQGLESIEQLDKLQRKKIQLEQDCQEYEKECMSLTVDGLRPVDLSPTAWIELKKKEWDEYQEKMHQRSLLLARLESVEEEIKIVSDEWQRISVLRQELLTLSGADSGEGFLHRGAINKRREELLALIRQWEITMFSGSDDRRREAILDILSTHDETELELASTQSEKELNEIEAHFNELQQKHGRLLQEQDQLELLCLHDTAVQKLEEQKAELKQMTANYAVMSICSELITRTRRIYEEEKQPQVLKLASIYFARLTNGAYSRIVMKMGAKVLLAEHRERGLIESVKLSRGTAEQMYLAMRLALAGTMNSQISIPLLFDDILVNFDQERMISALTLLQEVSPTRQIIMMTCHPYVVQHIRDIMPTAHIISLSTSI